VHQFEARLEIIGINPYVQVPASILQDLFTLAGKRKGPIPIKGTINGKSYRQTLVRYQGDWCLYVNTTMLKKSPQRIGEIVRLTISYDPSDRSVNMHPKLKNALLKTPAANQVFNNLIPSRQKEIVRYIAQLKSEESVDRNVKRAIDFLLGKDRFAGRDKP